MPDISGLNETPADFVSVWLNLCTFTESRVAAAGHFSPPAPPVVSEPTDGPSAERFQFSTDLNASL